ncbi:MAG: c-type cytochrome [Candidatus Binatia bacterium]
MAQLLGVAALLLILLIAAQPAAAQDKAEGKKLYITYCSGCHGESGKGDGPAAASLPVKPTNHTDGAAMNQLPDKFLFEIISKGGQAVSKSSFMPGWGNQLREKQIRDVIAHIRSLANPAYNPSGK